MKRLLIGLTLVCLLLATALPASAVIEPKIPVRSVRLNKSSMVLSPETTGKLTAKIYPSRAPKDVEYESSDTTVATVDAAGNVTAVDYGTCTITATAGRKTATCKVIVKDVPVRKVNIKKTALTISLNNTATLTYAVTPEGAKNKTLEWSSNNEAVATVTQDGTVTAVGKGKATIIAKATDGSGKKDSCKITVKAVGVQSIAIATDASVYLDRGASTTLTAKISPKNASYKDVVWSSDDESIVKIDAATGVAKAVGGGIATITATVQNGTKSDTQLLYVRSGSYETIKVTFGGDVVLGGEPRRGAKTNGTLKRFKQYLADNNGNPGFVFAGLKEVFENDDLTVVNLEGPLTTKTDWKSTAKKSHVFRGEPAYVRALSAGGVDAVSIRNNMVGGCGKAGVAETKAVLSNANVTWCDHEGKTIERNGKTIGLIGFFKALDSLNVVKRRTAAMRDQCDLLIVYFHWGEKSGSRAVSNIMKNNARGAVDAGADIVVGAGPHCLSGIEYYNGKYIVYGLGNLISGGRAGDNDTMLYQQTFKIYPDFAEAANQTIIGVFQTDEPRKLSKWQPVLMRQEADKARLIEKLKQYSKGLPNPGI